MPLYELLIISRCGDAKGTANLFRQMALTIFDRGGNIREMQILGDRILPKLSLANDKQKHLVGRYLQVLFDGNSEVKRAAEKMAENSFETIRYQTHKVKDFFNDAQLFKKAARQQSPIVDEDIKNRQFVKELMEILETKK